jgi:23S rRNA pseudouridine1911/1915/1917 synthase
MITNTVEESGRVDATVASQLNVSRSFVKVLLDQGKVSVNNNSVYKASAKVHPGDVLQIDFEPTTLADIPEIELDVLYKDDDCLVVYKPAGVLTHSKGAFNQRLPCRLSFGNSLLAWKITVAASYIGSTELHRDC